MTHASAEATTLRLVGDGCLVVEAAPAIERALAGWLPLSAAPGAPSRDAARIVVTAGRDAVEAPPRAPDLQVGTARAWIERDAALLRAAGGTTARIALGDREATVRLPDEEPAGLDVVGTMTIAAALLLGRIGRALAHAGCVVAPDGRAWLVIGDSHSGKTTTCTSLVEAGGEYVSDDTVVLARDADGAGVAEGWPRLMHLDPGFASGAPTGTRVTVSAFERWPARTRRVAAPAGILLPRVEAAAPTSGARAPSAEAFTALVRQSPWLLLDRGAGRTAMQLLRAIAMLPAYRLSLGLDSYGRPAALASVVGALAT